MLCLLNPHTSWDLQVWKPGRWTWRCSSHRVSFQPTPTNCWTTAFTFAKWPWRTLAPKVVEHFCLLANEQPCKVPLYIVLALHRTPSLIHTSFHSSRNKQIWLNFKWSLPLGKFGIISETQMLPTRSGAQLFVWSGLGNLWRICNCFLLGFIWYLRPCRDWAL